MRAVQRQPISLLDSWPAPDTDAVHQALREELRRFDRKVVVLDDDPTGVQTVHDISVYTDWTEETFRAGLESNDRLFFVLTNSRSFSAGETTRVHREIAEHLAAASQKTGVPLSSSAAAIPRFAGTSLWKRKRFVQSWKRCCRSAMTARYSCRFSWRAADIPSTTYTMSVKVTRWYLPVRRNLPGTPRLPTAPPT